MKRITKIEENMLLEKRKLRVAAYCRVSTARDEQLVSLAAQKAHYESYIKSNDEWEFAGLYYDEGISGTKKEKRDGLLSMVAACERGTIDMIITKSISRVARNTTDCLELVRKLLDLNIYIYFEKENINTGSMESELMLSILSGLAESESVSISENEKWGIKRRFQNGTFIISYPPYGYANVDGKMVVVPEQEEIVKQIFTDTLAGKSTHEIAEELNGRGVATKKGGHWTPGTVNAIIGNEKYTGDVLFQKTYTDNSFNRHQNRGELDQYLMQDHHEAIISREEFELANAVLKQRGREKGNGHDTGRYQNRYGFSGRICCEECGGKYKRRMHYKPSGQYVAWTCVNHLKDKESCSQKYITDDALKLAFVTMMNKLVFLNKKRVQNKGIVPQYYVENSHEPIIPRDLYMQVQEEMIRRANLHSGANRKKRVYSSKYALSSIVYCSKCGEIYRRIAWNNRGKHSTVWRCCNRVEHGPTACDEPTIQEVDLQAAVVQAINLALGNRESMMSTLQENIEAVIRQEDETSLEGIEAKLLDLQKELLKLANSKKDYNSVADEIDRLRELKQNALVESAEREGLKQRIREMREFLEQQSIEVTEYDELLVRRLIEKVTVYNERFEVEFKSGAKVDVGR